MGEDICLKNMVIKMNEMLKGVEWQEFEVSSLFTVESGKDITNKDKIIGDTPYVSSSDNFNGISHFIGNKKGVFDSGVLSVARTGSVGAVFYHEYKAIFSNNVRRLKLKYSGYNKYIYLFLVTSIRHQSEKYRYGYIMGTGRTLRQKILLPITIDGYPDWTLMENFMRELERKIKPEIVFKPHEISDNRELEEMEWKEFFVGDLFKLKRGRRLIKKYQTEGLRPYISSTGLNNGIDNFISNKDNVRIYNDCLTIANSGSVGEVFYHPYGFVASDHVTHIKKKGLNKYQYLFIATTFKKLGEKYSFNREISDKRLKREKIMLPILDNKQPDWNFMEQYIKQIENQIMKEVLSLNSI